MPASSRAIRAACPTRSSKGVPARGAEKGVTPTPMIRTRSGMLAFLVNDPRGGSRKVRNSLRESIPGRQGFPPQRLGGTCGWNEKGAAVYPNGRAPANHRGQQATTAGGMRDWNRAPASCKSAKDWAAAQEFTDRDRDAASAPTPGCPACRHGPPHAGVCRPGTCRRDSSGAI